MNSQTAVAEWARQMNLSDDVVSEVGRLAEASNISDPGGVMALGRIVLQERSANTQRNPKSEPTRPAMERLRLANRQNAHRDMRAERKRRNGR